MSLVKKVDSTTQWDPVDAAKAESLAKAGNMKGRNVRIVTPKLAAKLVGASILTGAVVAGVYLYYNPEKASALLNGAKGYTQAALTAARDNAAPYVTAAQQAVVSAYNTSSDAVVGAAKTARDFATPYAKATTDSVSSYVDAAYNATAPYASAASTAAAKAYNATVTTGSAWGSSVGSSLWNVAGKIGEVASKFPAFVRGTWGQAKTVLIK